MAASVGDGECAAILVWGDPSLFDSTIRLVEQLVAHGAVELEWSVVPGISSVALLAARHRITLNRVGRSVHVTTGRLVREGLPAGLDDVVVLLDGDTAFTTLVGQGYDIFWGAYLGTSDELLVSGPLDDVAESIVQTRREARQRLGWVFDTYLLRRREA